MRAMPDCLWIDASHGAAGDMLLGSLLDAGASLDVVREALARLSIEPVELTVEPVRRHGLRASLASIRTSASQVDRNIDDVLSVISAAGLAGPVGDFASAVFRGLARAEARVHGADESTIGFHEVGALDAIGDVVGCAAALHSLGMLARGAHVVVSTVAVGAGSSRSAHGQLPVPVPAVVELLAAAGAPVTSGGARRELCTPTGAALLTGIADDWGDCPAMTLASAGVGAGVADDPGHANVTRVLVGHATGRPGWNEQDLNVMESTVDDLEPRLLPGLLDELHRAGALDAWSAPVSMRRGRPGQLITALVAPADTDAVFAALVRHSPTLGARVYPVARRSLSRDQITVRLDGIDVAVKRGWLGEQVVTVQPEFADVARAAEVLGIAQRVALQRAADEARQHAGDRPLRD